MSERINRLLANQSLADDPTLTEAFAEIEAYAIKIDRLGDQITDAQTQIIADGLLCLSRTIALSVASIAAAIGRGKS